MGILLEIIFAAIAEAVNALIVDPWLKRLPRWGKIGCIGLMVAALIGLFGYVAFA